MNEQMNKRTNEQRNEQTWLSLTIILKVSSVIIPISQVRKQTQSSTGLPNINQE